MCVELGEEVCRCQFLSHLDVGVGRAGGAEGSPQGEQVNERWRGPKVSGPGGERDPAREIGIAASEVGRPEGPTREGLRCVHWI